MTERFLAIGMLLFLAISLFVPGMYHVLFLYPDGMLASTTMDGNNQIRALNAMMAAMGLMCLWCCFQIEKKHHLIHAVITILIMVSLSRIYSLFMDGLSSSIYLLYLSIEFILAFGLWLVLKRLGTGVSH